MIRIEPLSKPLDADVSIQGSKYIANRVLPIASFAKSPSTIKNCPKNEDIFAAMEGLKNLGAMFDEKRDVLEITPIKQRHPLKAPTPSINAHDSGTFTRFIAPLLSLSETFIDLSASSQMTRRPMGDLFNSLKEMGAVVESQGGFLPARIKGPLKKEEVHIDSSKSSQFVSSLMILAPHLKNGLTIHLEGKTISYPYILMTKSILERFGLSVQMSEKSIYIESNLLYPGTSYTIPTDPVSASYFFLLAAITEGNICISNYKIDELQKESIFPQILEKMGCSIKQEGSSFFLKGPEKLNPIDIDLNETPDIVPSLAVACMYTSGKSVLRNISQLRYKESDRLSACYENLKKMGIQTEIQGDDLVITGGNPKGANIDPKGDHRIAMSFTMAGFRTVGVVISDPHCVAKSFPTFWDLLKDTGLIFL